MSRTGHRPGTASTLTVDAQSPVPAGLISTGSGASRPPIRLLSPCDAGRYLGCSVWTVREMIWSGRLPVVRVGRLTRLDVRDLDAWVDTHKERQHG